MPISEATIKAGSEFGIPFSLKSPSPQGFRASVFFRSGSGASFQCDVSSAPDQIVVRLSCQTTQSTSSGEYRADEDSFVLENGDLRQTVTGVRFPIITVVDADPIPPPPPRILPQVQGDATLSLDLRNSFFDASIRSDAILKEIGVKFKTVGRDTYLNRAYLSGQIRLAKSTVDLTRSRIADRPESVKQLPSGQIPPMFEDFDRRLDAILQRLSSRRASVRENGTLPRLIRASTLQLSRPQASQSVTVAPTKEELDSTLQKAFDEFVPVLEDMVKGFLEISKDGSTTFTWSLTTEPAGAEVYLSRLGEKEVKWAGVSNLENQPLPKLRWTFRVSWSGCSKLLDLNPWLQNPIPLREEKLGCKYHADH
ncbi:hypothetical protein [Granulicella sibirica]|uniref:hypothetical protein n=1 Tax=Granulicella sibirica TaxID=2479048 RepID=UPI001008DBCF|nr:hypothetical protein [Granulicella sibirica]